MLKYIKLKRTDIYKMENREEYIKKVNNYIINYVNNLNDIETKVFAKYITDEDKKKYFTNNSDDVKSDDVKSDDIKPADVKVDEIKTDYKSSLESEKAPEVQYPSADDKSEALKLINDAAEKAKADAAKAPEAPKAPISYSEQFSQLPKTSINKDNLMKELLSKRARIDGGGVVDLRTVYDFKQIFKELIQDLHYYTSSDDKYISDIVKNGINNSSDYKLFLGGATYKNIYDSCWDLDNTIIEYTKNGIVNYQCMKYEFLKDHRIYRNKKRMEEDVKNNKDVMAKYIKWILTTFDFPQMKKFIGSTASLFNYSTATPEEPTDSNIKALLSFYLLKDFFKRNNNQYIAKDLYGKIEYKPLTNKKIIPLRLLHGSVKPDIHFDKMIADRYTNSSKSFTPNDLTNLLGMMNFQEKLKNQVGGGQYGGSHLYEHIFENLQHKLAGYKIKINHNDEAEISKYIKALADNEKKIVDSLDTIKKFTYSKNIGDYKGYEVSVDDMYNEIIKTRKDSADKEDKLMSFITKLNRWIKEHFNE